MSPTNKYGYHPNDYSKSGEQSRPHHKSRYSRRMLRYAPQASRCIGIFGLNTITTEDKLYNVFDKFGPIEHIQMVNFTQTYVSRGFCFIYFENLRDAQDAKRQCTGMEIDGRPIRVVYSITSQPHKPTPGVYMGRPSRRFRSRSRERNIGSRSRSHSGQRHKEKNKEKTISE